MRRMTASRPAWWQTAAVALGAGLLLAACGSGGGLYGDGGRAPRGFRGGGQPALRGGHEVPVRLRLRLTRRVTAVAAEPAPEGSPATARPGSVIAEPGRSRRRTVRRAGHGWTARDAHPYGVTRQRRSAVTVHCRSQVTTFSAVFREVRHR